MALTPFLHVEAEFDDVAVLHDVVLAFQSHKALFTGSLFAATGNEVIVGNNFSTDEAFFKVRMDLASCLRCRRSFDDGPGTRFHFPCREEGLET